jgi:hypothetical protein
MSTHEPASIIAARQLAGDAHARRHRTEPGTRAVLASARRRQAEITERRTAAQEPTDPGTAPVTG